MKLSAEPCRRRLDPAGARTLGRGLRRGRRAVARSPALDELHVPRGVVVREDRADARRGRHRRRAGSWRRRRPRRPASQRSARPSPSPSTPNAAHVGGEELHRTAAPAELVLPSSRQDGSGSRPWSHSTLPMRGEDRPVEAVARGRRHVQPAGIGPECPERERGRPRRRLLRQARRGRRSEHRGRRRRARTAMIASSQAKPAATSHAAARGRDASWSRRSIAGRTRAVVSSPRRPRTHRASRPSHLLRGRAASACSNERSRRCALRQPTRRRGGSRAVRRSLAANASGCAPSMARRSRAAGRAASSARSIASRAARCGPGRSRSYSLRAMPASAARAESRLARPATHRASLAVARPAHREAAKAGQRARVAQRSHAGAAGCRAAASARFGAADLLRRPCAPRCGEPELGAAIAAAAGLAPGASRTRSSCARRCVRLRVAHACRAST